MPPDFRQSPRSGLFLPRSLIGRTSVTDDDARDLGDEIEEPETPALRVDHEGDSPSRATLIAGWLNARGLVYAALITGAALLLNGAGTGLISLYKMHVERIDVAIESLPSLKDRISDADAWDELTVRSALQYLHHISIDFPELADEISDAALNSIPESSWVPTNHAAAVANVRAALLIVGDLAGRDLSGKWLEGCDFKDKDLTGTHFVDSRLVESEFGGRQRSASGSDKSLAAATNFSGADMSATRFINFEGRIEALGTTWDGACFLGDTHFVRSRFRGGSSTLVLVMQAVRFTECEGRPDDQSRPLSDRD